LEQRQQVTVRQPMARQKICLTAKLSIFVPRADRLAVIATEYPVTHGLSKLFGYGSGVFDRQIGDTAAGIKDVRLGKRVRGADFEAGGTVAAAIGLPGVVHRQREKGKQLPEKKPAAGLAVEDQGVLSGPAQPGLFCQGAFHDRRAVDKGAVLDLAFTGKVRRQRGIDALGQLAEAFAD